MVRHRFGVEPATIADPAAAIIHGARCSRPHAEKPSRGTGVKLHRASTRFAVDLPLRSKLTTLLSASSQSIHSKPAGSQSTSCCAGSCMVELIQVAHPEFS